MVLFWNQIFLSLQGTGRSQPPIYRRVSGWLRFATGQPVLRWAMNSSNWPKSSSMGKSFSCFPALHQATYHSFIRLFCVSLFFSTVLLSMLTRLYFPFRRDSSFCSADKLETLEFPPGRYGEALSSEGSFPGRTCPGPRPPTCHRHLIEVLLSPLPHPAPPHPPQLFTPPPVSTHSQHTQLQGLFLPPVLFL